MAYLALAAWGIATGLVLALVVQADCFSLVTEQGGRPQLRTPRAAVCRPLDYSWRWIVLPALNAGLSLLIARLTRRTQIGEILGALAALVIVGAGTIVLTSLGYSTPAG